MKTSWPLKSFLIGASICPALFLILYIPYINSAAAIILTILTMFILEPFEEIFYSTFETSLIIPDIFPLPTFEGFIVLSILAGLVAILFSWIWIKMKKSPTAL